MILIYHVLDNGYIVLKIRIDRNTYIAKIGCSYKACGKRILMAYVPGKLYAVYLIGIFLMLRFDELPCLVSASVVDKHDKAVDRYLTLINEIVEDSPECLGAHLQYFFFVIAGYYDSKTFHFNSSLIA